MDWSIEDCINYCSNQDLIDLVTYNDLINELYYLRKNQEYLTNIKLYYEEDHNKNHK